MNIPTLMYHDVVTDADWDSSGFAGEAASHYKFARAEFARHLAALAASGLRFSAVTAPGFDADDVCLLTFDDGGKSAVEIASLLDGHGMIGHFFITTRRIGTPGFVSAADIAALHGGGHVVGSHSHTHPAEISRLAPAVLDAEWRQSVDRLAQILGSAVTVASVPGGFFAPAVARSAAAAGIRQLFTSEPVVRIHWQGDCRVLGRYALWRGMSAAQALALARGSGAARQRQWLVWNVKKPLKRWARPLYQFVRQTVRGT